jgi:tripartite-type tricarboxylate transporter receptor subunit TctC
LRVLAPALSDKLGQNFIVENVSGGATTIATGRVARAAPDGYTLLLHNLPISANVSLYHNLPFDTEKDLAPVIFINHNPLVLIGRKTLEPNTLKELIAYMKSKVLKMAHPGVGRHRPPRHLAVCAGSARQIARWGQVVSDDNIQAPMQ